MAITMRDVAKLARVSTKTVSRVVNREGPVREETRDRVWRAIEQLDYRPELSARGTSGARAYSIGLIYDNPNPYYVIAMQEGTLAACLKLGYGVQIYPFHSRPPGAAEALQDLVLRARLAGLVLAPPMSERTALLDKLADYDIPLVRVISAAESPRDRFACIFVDDRSAAYAITEHLIQLGHSRIGFLWGRKEYLSSAERYKGYELALRDYGLSPVKELVVHGDYTFDDGFRGAHRLLQLARPPTAIFGSNDEIAAGALAAARALGVEVPYGLSIAGFEDSPFSRHSWPSLTTARQRTELIAEHAARLLIARIHGNEVENEGFKPELIVRGSTAPPRPRP